VLYYFHVITVKLLWYNLYCEKCYINKCDLTWLIQLDSSSITPSRSVRNLGAIFDDQLTFTDHITKTARSCRFAMYNIRKIKPFLTQHATQLLVQTMVISRLDYCNSLLAGLLTCATKTLQIIQNAEGRLVFNKPKRAHVTPLFISLHWLPLAACIKFKALSLAYSSHHHRISSLLLPLILTHKSTSLPEAYDQSMSDGSWYHQREPQNHSPEHSHSRYHAGGKICPPSSRMQDPWQRSKDNWKLISSVSTYHYNNFLKN